MSVAVKVQSRWVRLVDERLVLGVIGFNMLVLFVHAFPIVRGSQLASVLAALDYACLVYFLAEISIKLKLSGWSAFWSRSMNRFDFVIVAVSIPALVTVFTEMSDLSWILVLRGFRLMRFLRVLRFVPHAEKLWAGVMRALRASVALIIALMLYNFVLGLIASHLFAEVSPEHFGDPLLSVYTIFKVFTVEGWFDVPDLVARTHGGGVAWMVRGFFIVAVVSGGLLGLSLTNAVLVDEMVMDNNNELEVQVDELTAKLDDLAAQNADLHAQLSRKLDELLARPPDA